MSDELVKQGRAALVASRAALLKRFDASVDANERAQIATAIDAINGKMDSLDLTDLLSAAMAVGDISSELETVIGSAKQRPLDASFDAVLAAFKGLDEVRGKMHAVDALPRVPDEPAAGAAPLAGAPAGVAITKSKDFDDIADEYKTLFDTCIIDEKFRSNVQYYLKHVGAGKSAYAAVTERFGIPWYLIGIIHGMECGFNFNTHLHNGDPLRRKTVNVPKGRPKTGTPPFSWRESAEDALIDQGLTKVSDWIIPRMLYVLEKYNGFGYRNMGSASPYLWSFSNHYKKGKYVADGKFDPEAVSKQCGAAVILKAGKAAQLF